MARILFLLEDYNRFYTNETNRIINSFSHASYDSIINDLIKKKYYQSDSMASAFGRLGHYTKLIVPEANPLQLLWLKENNRLTYNKWKLERPIRSFKSRILKQHRNSFNSIQFSTLLLQVKNFKPDIIYVYSNIIITEHQIKTLKKFCKKIVLQWACPLFDEKLKFPYHAFDLIITAAIQFKQYFESKKYPVFYSQQAFDDSILEQVLDVPKNELRDVIFIGSFTPAHQYRFQVLEFLLQSGINLTIYGLGKETLDKNSKVYNVMKGPLFGLEMYNEYRKYKMALHIHITGYKNDGIDWDKYAGAKRLFEITGIGTLLFTPQQENVKDLFEIGKEVITFVSAEDLAQKIEYNLKNPELAEGIAKSGMQRTLKDHSFTARAKELSKFLFN